MHFKQKIYNYCNQIVFENIDLLQNNLNELSEGIINNNKNSAGDKHETLISMMQLEQEKIRKQLRGLLEQKSILEKLDITNLSNQIFKGSLVKTNSMFLFISIPLGKINIDNKSVIILSSQSPLGLKLMSKKVNDSVILNGVKYTIECIE